MGNSFDSHELTEFVLSGQINLEGKCGLIKILRSQDGRLILVTDSDFGLIDQEKPTLSRCGSTDALLGFVLDIGVRREKMLTYGDGFYFGTPLIQSQSSKTIDQSSYDGSLMEEMDESIQKYYQSGDPTKEAEAVKMSYLIRAYNDARLQYPNFYSDSYLSLMRILDAIFQTSCAFSYATQVTQISRDFNGSLYAKIAAIAGYASRLTSAEKVFTNCLAEAERKKEACASQMKSFDQNDKLVFSCFYSAYQYRNKFVHWGLPFPDIVKETVGGDLNNGIAYLHPALGISSIKVFRPGGLQTGDDLDMHCILSDADEIKRFKEDYFQLIPTFHFLKELTRLAMINSITVMK